MKKISTRRYENQIKEILKSKGFDDSQIICLTKAYTRYESEHELERIENFSSVLDLLVSGIKPSTDDMKDKFLR